MPAIPNIPLSFTAAVAASAFLVAVCTQAARPLIAAARRHPPRLGALRDLVAGNPLLLVIAGIGFSLSFQTISDEARRLGMPGWAPLYPIGIDVGILALVIEARRAIDDDRSDLVPRLGAWGLSILTIVINAQGASTWGLARLLHIIMPSLWVLFLELTRWRKLRRARAAKRAERIPLARWLADWPWRTLGMKRRMVLSNVTSYPVACAREEARMLATDLARAEWGSKWKRDAPPLFVHQIRNGSLPGDVSRMAQLAAIGTSPAMAEPVSEWVTQAATERVKVAVKVKRERQRIEASADASASPPADASAELAAKSRSPRQRDAVGRRKVTRLLTDDPDMPRAEVARRAGVSESTVDRVKRDLPTPLHVAGGRRAQGS